MDTNEILMYARIAYKSDDYQVLDACVVLLTEEAHKAKTPHKKAMIAGEISYWQKKLDDIYNRL